MTAGSTSGHTQPPRSDGGSDCSATWPTQWMLDLTSITAKVSQQRDPLHHLDSSQGLSTHVYREGNEPTSKTPSLVGGGGVGVRVEALIVKEGKIEGDVF